MFAFVNSLGRQVNQTAETTGYGLLLLFDAVVQIKSLFKSSTWRSFSHQIGISCIEAIPVTIVVSVFVGMILALNGGISLSTIGQNSMIGRIVAVAMIREMGPFMTGLILAASIGSAMAAEVGTMKVSEEIDALNAMGVDPTRFLVMPRLVSMSILCPIMTVYASLMGIAGGAILANTQLGVGFTVFRNDALMMLTMKDVFTGIFKAFVFGIIISTVGCTQGLLAKGGAIGVGYATRRAVVISYILIIISGYYITWFFYR